MNIKLEEAKKLSKPKRVFTDDDIEVAIAWATGEITFHGLMNTLSPTNSTATVYLYLAHCFRAYIKKHDIRTNSNKDYL